MAEAPGWDILVASGSLLILLLMLLNAYVISRRPVLRRVREIYFINHKAFQRAWLAVLAAMTFLVTANALDLARVIGLTTRVIVSTLASIAEAVFVGLMIVAFALLFRIFTKYVTHVPIRDIEIESKIQQDLRRSIVLDDTQTRLDLSRVGDVFSGRRRLGPFISLTHYRGLTIGFSKYAEEKLGHLGDSLLHSVGRLTARTAMEDVMSEIPDREDALRRMFDEIRANGIAIPELVDRSEHKAAVRLHENATSAGVQPAGRPICHYQSGMVAGIFEALVGHRVFSREVRCWGLGDKFCEFELDLSPAK